jgi:hypothetical protein
MTFIIDFSSKMCQHFKKPIMKKSMKLLYWSPRILAIVAILFISIFALDAFEPGRPFSEQLVAFLIHLVPSFILLAILLLAWKRELAGGILFALIGLATTPWVFMHNYRMNHSIWMSLLIILMITIPFVVVGGLFIWDHFRRRRLG